MIATYQNQQTQNPLNINDIPEEVAFDELVASSGNAALAAERICTRLGWPVTSVIKSQIKAAMPRLVAQRLPELKRHMEAVAALELFSMMPILSKTLFENLTNLEGKDAVSAYMQLMSLVNKAVDPHELHIDHRWQAVPRELQDLYTELAATGELDKIIAGDVT